MGQEMSLLKEARELLRAIPPSTKKEILRAATDRFAEANDLFKTSCTRSALRDLIGSATVLCVAISAITTPTDNPPKSDAAREDASEGAVAPKSAVG